MYSIKYIKIKNFISHKESIIHLDENKPYLIYGKNQDNEGANSNGSGKSTIAEAIVYSVLGATYDNKNKEDLIRIGEKQAELEIAFCDLKNNSFVVKRAIPKSGSAKCQVVENDEVNNDLISVQECNDYILRKLGLRKEEFLNYFVISQGNNANFLSSTDTQQKDVIFKFLDLSVFDTASQDSKEIIKELEKKIAVVSNSIQELKSNKIDIETETSKIQKEVNTRYEALEENYKTELQAIEQKILLIEEKIEEKTSNQKLYNKKLQDLDIEIKEIDSYNQNYYNKITSLNKEAEVLQDSLKKLKDHLKNYTLSLKHITVCPNCNHEFVIEKGSKENLEKEKSNIETSIKNLDIDLKSKYDDIEKLQNNIDTRITELLIERNELEDLNTSVAHELESLYERLKDNQDIPKKIQEQIKLLEKNKSEEIESRTNEVSEKENSRKKLLKVKELSLKSLEKKKINEEKVLFHLSKKGVPSFIVNKTLKHLEYYINYYLRKFNTDLFVTIEGYKETTAKKLSEKINVLVGRYEQPLVNIKRFSGGEKNRLQLASILAIQSFINSNSESGGLNLLFLDETFNFLDSEGQYELVKCLSSLNQTVLSISHNHDFIVNDEEIMHGVKTIFCEKRNGVTTIL